MTLTGTRRRPPGLLLALAIVVGAALSVLDGDDSPAGPLGRRIDEAGAPSRFEYTFRRGGIRVLDCVLANTGYRPLAATVAAPAPAAGEVTASSAVDLAPWYPPAVRANSQVDRQIRTPRPHVSCDAASQVRDVGRFGYYDSVS